MDFNPMDYGLFESISHVFTCYILICCAMWSVQCATYCYAACLVSLCNYKTIHSIAQPLSTQTENVKKHLSWFFLLKFHIQTSHFFNFGGLRLPSWWWNLRLLRRFWWGRHLRHLRSRMRAPDCYRLPLCIDCLCASTAFVHRLPFVCYFDLFCAHISHISLDPPGPSGHSRKVQQHLQGRRQNRAKHGDTMWHNVTQCDICWTKLAYYCALQRGSVLPTSMGSDFRQSRTG